MMAPNLKTINAKLLEALLEIIELTKESHHLSSRYRIWGMHDIARSALIKATGEN